MAQGLEFTFVLGTCRHTTLCNCQDEIKDMKVYHSYDEYEQDISWFEYLKNKGCFKHEAPWNDPDWKYLPSRFIVALMQGFPELSRSSVTDKRQEFLLEDILEDLTTDCFVELACIMTDMVITHCC